MSAVVEPATDGAVDIAAIRAVIAAQFAALVWQPGTAPDYAPLLEGFVDDARLYPARRPLAPQSATEFCARLDRLRANGELASFAEHLLGVEIRVFGNVAVALAGCAMLENDSGTSRDVSGFLLVRDQARWRIAAQAWDYERPGLALPAHLAEAPGSAGDHGRQSTPESAR